MTDHTVSKLKNMPFGSFEKIIEALNKNEISLNIRRDVALDLVKDTKNFPSKIKSLTTSLVLLPFLSGIGLFIYIIYTGSWWLLLSIPLILVGLFISHPSSTAIFGSLKSFGFIAIIVSICVGYFNPIPWLFTLSLVMLINTIAFNLTYVVAVNGVLNEVKKSEHLFCILWTGKALSISMRDGSSLWVDMIRKSDGTFKHFSNTEEDKIAKLPNFDTYLLQSMLITIIGDEDFYQKSYPTMKNIFFKISSTKLTDTDFHDFVDKEFTKLRNSKSSAKAYLEDLKERATLLTREEKEKIFKSLIKLTSSVSNSEHKGSDIIILIGDFFEIDRDRFSELFDEAVGMAPEKKTTTAPTNLNQADINTSPDDKKSVRTILEDRQKYLDSEKPFMVIDLGTRKAPIKPSDIQSVANVMLFAWKHAKMEKSKALDYSILTFVLTIDGTEQEKNDAETTMSEALNWSIMNKDLDFAEKMALTLECAHLIKVRLGVA